MRSVFGQSVDKGKRKLLLPVVVLKGRRASEHDKELGRNRTFLNSTHVPLELSND